MVKQLITELLFLTHLKMAFIMGIVIHTEENMCFVKICRDMNDKMDLDRYSPLHDPPRHRKLLNTAPCPPPWEMSLLFSTSLCLDCSERIYILLRCLQEWNMEVDCENFLSCEDCISCDICASNMPTNETTSGENLHTTITTKTGDKETDTVLLWISVSIIMAAFCTIIITLVIILRYDRKRATNGKRLENMVFKAETQVALLKEESVELPENKTDADKLLKELRLKNNMRQ